MNTKSPISELFAPRANDARVSQSSRRRYETVSAADFGSMVADFSAKPKSQVVDRSANSSVSDRRQLEKNVRSSPKSETRSSTKAAVSKAPVQQRNQNNAALETAGKNSITPVKSHAATEVSHDFQSSGSVEFISAEAELAQRINFERVNATSANLSGKSEASIVGTDKTEVVNGNLRSVSISGSPLIDMPIASSTIESVNSDTKNATQAELAARLFEEVSLSNKTPEQIRSGSFESLKAPIAQSVGNQFLSSVGGNELQNLENLIRDFDLKQVGNELVDAEAKSGQENLKAFEQLNSVKPFAAHAIRTMMSQRQVKQSSSPGPLSAAPQADALQVNGALVSNAVEGVTALTANQAFAKEFFALQQQGLDEALSSKGNVSSVEDALQLQTGKSETKSDFGAKSLKAVGKLVVPEKFGAVLKSGVQSLQLKIAPKHLGTAELTVKLVKDHIQGTLTVTSEAARAAALSSIENLAVRLSEEGLTLDSLNVEVSQEGESQGRNELERQYADTLQSGLIQRAFERNDEAFPSAAIEHSLRSVAPNILSAETVDIRA